MLEELKEKVLLANLKLAEYKLVVLTWGNVSAKDADSGLIVIKPGGIPYPEMKAADMVVVDESGKVVEGKMRPSSDTPTHLELYRAFPELGGIAHTHSTFAASWAQTGRDIPAYGTTHADYFYGDIPCTRSLGEEETKRDYEKNTGRVIAECFRGRNLSPDRMPGVLVRSHGVFTFGEDAGQAVLSAVVLEEVAKMAYFTQSIRPEAARADDYISEKHFFRKHGPEAYYGQPKNTDIEK